MLENYKYLFGARLDRAARAARPARDRQDDQRRPPLGRRRPVQFQPGELAKIFLIIFLAGYLRDKREVLAQFRLKDFGPLFLIWGAAMLVLVQTSDLGSALLYFGIFLAMLYVATGRAVFVAGGAGALRPRRHGRLPGRLARPGARHDLAAPVDDRAGAVRDHRQRRAAAGLRLFQLVTASTRSRTAASAAPGSGAARSRTPTASRSCPSSTPTSSTPRSRRSSGLIGACGLMLVYMLFITRGMRIALMAQDGFSKLLAAGLTFGFALQAFIIVGGVLRVIPLTGITLPFVSYGGSSVVANFILLALLLHVSNRANAVGR